MHGIDVQCVCVSVLERLCYIASVDTYHRLGNFHVE